MTGPHGHGHHGHQVGPLAQEAALLLNAVSQKLDAARTAAALRMEEAIDIADGAEPTTPVCPECGRPDTTATAGCTACPWCRLLAVVRGERPEVSLAVLDAASTLVRAVRDLIPEPTAPQDVPTARAGDEPSPDRVVRIEVR